MKEGLSKRVRAGRCAVTLAGLLSCSAIFLVYPTTRARYDNIAYQCIQDTKEAWIIIVGDSNARHLFKSLVYFTFTGLGIDCLDKPSLSWEDIRRSSPACVSSSPLEQWSDRDVVGTFGDARGVRLSFRFVPGSDTKVRMLFSNMSQVFAKYAVNKTVDWDYAQPVLMPVRPVQAELPAKVFVNDGIWGWSSMFFPNDESTQQDERGLELYWQRFMSTYWPSIMQLRERVVWRTLTPVRQLRHGVNNKRLKMVNDKVSAALRSAGVAVLDANKIVRDFIATQVPESWMFLDGCVHAYACVHACDAFLLAGRYHVSDSANWLILRQFLQQLCAPRAQHISDWIIGQLRLRLTHAEASARNRTDTAPGLKL